VKGCSRVARPQLDRRTSTGPKCRGVSTFKNNFEIFKHILNLEKKSFYLFFSNTPLLCNILVCRAGGGTLGAFIFQYVEQQQANEIAVSKKMVEPATSCSVYPSSASCSSQVTTSTTFASSEEETSPSFILSSPSKNNTIELDAVDALLSMVVGGCKVGATNKSCSFVFLQTKM
jgi:hypothetical protein